MCKSASNTLYSVEIFDGVKERLWNASVSANTAAAYKTGFEHFCQFVTLYGMANQPGDLPTIGEQLLIMNGVIC